jgi:hypothetical protein
MSTQVGYGRDRRARQRHPRRGNVDQYLPAVMQALLNLNRPWGLIDSVLVNLASVQADVQDGGMLAEAYALQRQLRKALEAALAELGGGDRDSRRSRTILQGIEIGKSIRRIAAEDFDGHWRETVQKSWWPQAARLVAHHLLAGEKDLQ